MKRVLNFSRTVNIWCLGCEFRAFKKGILSSLSVAMLGVEWRLIRVPASSK